jgi:hypothetical protein
MKSSNTDRKTLATHLSSVAAYAKKFTTEESYAKQFNEEAFGQFVGLIKEIQEVQDQAEINHKLIDKILQSLTPLVASVKALAVNIHKSDSDASLNASGRHKSSESMLDPHGSGGELNKSLKVETLKHSKSIGSDSLLSDVASIDLEPSPVLSRKKENMKSPLGDSNSAASSFSQLPELPAPKTPHVAAATPTTAMRRADSTLTISTVEFTSANFQVKSLTPTTIDIYPTAFEDGAGKYGVVLDISVNRPRTGEDLRTIRKSDKEIKQLAEKLQLLAPVNLPRFMDCSAGKPSLSEMNAVLESSKAFFNYISHSTSLLKSQPVINFVHEGFINLEFSTPKIPVTPTQQNHGRGSQEEVEGLFFTPQAKSTVNRFSIYQVDPDTGHKKTVESATSGVRTSKFFTFRGSKYFSKGSEAEIKDSSSIKSDSTSEADVPTGAWGASRASKLFGLGSRASLSDSTASFRSKADTFARRSVRDSFGEKDMRERAVSMSKKKFDLFAETHKDKFVRTADDTLSMVKDGKEVLSVKNINGNPRVMACELETFVECILSNQPFQDSALVECFLVTYRHFMKPHELLIKIVEKFKNSSAAATPEATETGQTQIVSFLSLWVNVSWDDFDKDQNLQGILYKFIEIIKNTKKISGMASQILSIVDTQVICN